MVALRKKKIQNSRYQDNRGGVLPSSLRALKHTEQEIYKKGLRRVNEIRFLGITGV